MPYNQNLMGMGGPAPQPMRANPMAGSTGGFGGAGTMSPGATNNMGTTGGFVPTPLAQILGGMNASPMARGPAAPRPLAPAPMAPTPIPPPAPMNNMPQQFDSIRPPSAPMANMPQQAAPPPAPAPAAPTNPMLQALLTNPQSLLSLLQAFNGSNIGMGAGPAPAPLQSAPVWTGGTMGMFR